MEKEFNPNNEDKDYTFYFVLPIEEIDERMKQLKHETVEDSVFIMAEEICNEYINSFQDKTKKQYDDLVSKLVDCRELIIKHAQFLINKMSTIEFVKSIIEKRETMKKCTAVFSDRELDFLKSEGK